MVSVEKLCINLWVNLWRSCGKEFLILWISYLYTILNKFGGLFHDMVEKFSLGFYTRFYRDKVVVLHSFHSPYYYYY